MLKSITLHRPAIDNADGFQDSGVDLVVGDSAKAGVIDAARAKDLVSGHGASGHYDAAKSKRAPKEAAKRAPRKAPASLPVEPVKAGEPVEVKAAGDLGTPD